MLVLVTVTVLSFLFFRFLGDPVVAILGAGSTAPQREAVRHELGLDGSVVLQFARYLGHVATGQFGVSYRLGQPVARILAERVPATVELAGTGMALALLGGIPAGIYTALHRRRLGGELVLGASLLGLSMPSFFMGMVLIWVFSLTLGWLPSFGRGTTVQLGPWSTGFLTISGLKALVMPALTVAVFQLATILRLVRAEMLEVIGADFIRFARARGLTDRTVYLRHALRNALLPVVTVAGLQFGSLVAFAVVTESVFQWPGLGLLFLQSVAAADVPVLSAYLLLIAVLFVAINLLVDLLYGAIDPRLRVAASRVAA